MDAFTENILARARERQRMLEGYTGGEKVPLRETNKNLITSSEPNLTDVKKTNRKEVVSDSNISSDTHRANAALKENKSENNLTRFSRQNSKTRVSSEMPGSPQPQMKTLNIQKENFNMEIKLTSSDNIRVEVEIEEQDNSDSGSTISESGLRDESKNKLKRLGRLYAGGDEPDISSPIHRTEAKFYAAEENDEISVQKSTQVTESGMKFRKGLSKLADLAQTINQWEDDVNHTRNVEQKCGTPKKTWKPPAPQPPNTTSPPKSHPVKLSQKPKAPDPPVVRKDSPVKGVSEVTNSPTKSSGSAGNTEKSVTEPTQKQLKWDQVVLDSLESQGFMRTSSKSRLVYSYNSQERSSNSEVKTAQTTHIAKAQLELKHDTITEEEEEYPKERKLKQVPVEEKSTKMSPSKVNRAANIADKAAIFESSPSRNVKDPALLSVSERKALFEKNKGGAIVPKAPIGLSAPVRVESVMKPSNVKIITEENVKPSIVSKVENAKANTVLDKPKPIDEVKVLAKTPLKNRNPAPRPPVEGKASDCSYPTRAMVHQAGGIASKMAALLENKSTISQEQIQSGIKEQRQKEMDMLLNRFNKNKMVQEDQIEEIDSDDDVDATEETAMITEKAAKVILKSGEKRKSGGKPYSKGDSPIVASVLDDVKRVRVSPAKPGQLYPNLSDIEATTETDTRSPSPDSSSSSEENNCESDDPNTSFGREILQAVCKNQSPQKRPIYDESTASDVSSILDDMDNYVDDLSNEENESTGPTPPKQVRQVFPNKTAAQPSKSFNYKSFSPSVNTSNSKTPVKVRTSPKKPVELPTHVVVGDDVLPLTHTVSFYRKQQSQVLTPVRQITRQPLIEESPQEVKEENGEINKKIVQLQEEVNKQQNIISQTSQALNLCSCTPEFSGSTEQVEAERVLLVATHRRQAALHEMQRLKVEGTIRPQGQHAQNVPLEKGTLTISHIVLPLKQKYVKALAAAGGKGHHVVCLVKCGEQVVPTKLVSTVVSNTKNPDVDLSVPGNVTINNIYSDFTITFEVYCLQAQEEFLPHEVKYHISNKKSSNKLTTPKKSKQDSRMVMPIKESPAGPQAVRTSSFALMGYAVFSVQAVNKRVWSLNNTPSMSPLEGSVEMRICCELAVSVEHRGFLTMFEDVSGFGAWHRRWCLLKGHTLSYWKYPDDERKMAPIDTIDLKNCVTEQVGLVSRDICARLHTFLLERERMAHSQDKDTLVTICKGDKTIIRHLLSADTKEERMEWCTKFNAAFTALRMWGGTQQ